MHDSREAVGGGLGTDALPHEIFLQGKERTCRYGGHNETQASLEDHLRTWTKDRMKDVFPTEYCPTSITIGFASKSACGASPT